MMALAAVMSVTACGQNKKTLTMDKTTKIAESKRVVNNNLRDDIAEMLLVGFRGTELTENNHIRRDIEEHHIGGVILFEYDGITGTHGRNIVSEKQLKKLCSQLQSASKETLFIGIDQEGGKVCRLGKKQGFPVIPSAEAMAKGGVDTVMRYSMLTAEILHRVGINLNFAPCVDVYNSNCPVIGNLGRSFGEEPDLIAQMAEAWIKGHEKAHVMCCLKHFPGHGNSTGDTHKGLVDVTEVWTPEEMEPYRILCNKGIVDMVMTAHVVNEKWDGKTPASLNRHVNEILRNDIQFDRIVITDDLCMGAITKMYPYKEVLQRAIASGANLLCLSNNGDKYDEDLVPKTIKLICELVEEGSIDAENIHKSAEMIRKYKNKLQEN